MVMKHVIIGLCASIALSSCSMLNNLAQKMPVSARAKQEQTMQQQGSYAKPSQMVQKSGRRGCNKCRHKGHDHKVAQQLTAPTSQGQYAQPTHTASSQYAPPSLYMNQKPATSYPTAGTISAPQPTVASSGGATFMPYDPSVPTQVVSNQPINYYPEYSYARQAQPGPPMATPISPTMARPNNGLPPVQYPAGVNAPSTQPMMHPSAISPTGGQMLPNGTMLPAGLPAMPASAMNAPIPGAPGPTAVGSTGTPDFGSFLPGSAEAFSIHPSHDPTHPDFDPNNIPSTPPAVTADANYQIEATTQGVVGYDKAMHYQQGQQSNKMQQLKQFLGY